MWLVKVIVALWSRNRRKSRKMAKTTVDGLLLTGFVLGGLGAVFLLTRLIVPKEDPKEISTTPDVLELLSPYLLGLGIALLIIGGIGWLRNNVF
jgi:hypothetical protein